MLYTNGNIFTLDATATVANYMLVEGGKISVLGQGIPEESLLREHPTFNLNGRVVLPGFCDAHIHIWKVGQLLTDWLDVRSTTGMLDLQERLESFARTATSKDWITARGFNEQRFSPAQVPDRYDLDEVISDRPVFLMRTCAHQAVLNSKALEVCNINAGTVAPYGGQIEKDERGEPTGILHETALGLVTPLLPKLSEADYIRYFVAAGKELQKWGVTAACDPGVDDTIMKAYRKAEAGKELPIKLNVMGLGLHDDGSVATLPERYFSDFLTVSTIKFFSDGALSGKTAALNTDYPGSNQKGMLRLEKDTFRGQLSGILAKSYNVATHAIGDRAIEFMLEAYQEQRTIYKDNILRIEHCGLPDDAMKDRMAASTIDVVTQPIFLKELGANITANLPDGYLERCYPVRSLLERGIRCAFSTDAPVVRSLNPFVGILSAITRSDGGNGYIAREEAITKQCGVTLYSRAAAELSECGSYQGQLAPGSPADFIVLRQTEPEYDKEDLPQVVQTYINGKCVYQDEKNYV